MKELPEEAIEAAEKAGRPDHSHGGVDEANLLEHVRSTHGLDAPDHLSETTLRGLHDRLHRETRATDH